jgi:ABC-type transporter Mla MlaB component
MTTTGARSVAFAIRGPIRRGDLPGLCARVRRLLANGRPEVVLCDVRGVAPDAVTVDALARLQLAAGRHGCVVRLEHASDELRALVEFMGLSAVLAGAGTGQGGGRATGDGHLRCQSP